MAEKIYPRKPPEWMKDYPVLLKLWKREGASFQKELDKLVDDTTHNARYSGMRDADPMNPYYFGWG